ncbi:MAG: pyridoxal phosphate-dependent aminotransferase [Vicinamibacterales bacterium]
MSLSRRGFITRLAPAGDAHAAAVVAARGREALVAESLYGEVGGLVPPAGKEIRISSNENPLGPGPHVLDAITGKFPEAGRYPFNSTPNEGALVGAVAKKFSVKNENVVMGAGSGEILTNAVRAFTSATRPLVTAWPSFENPHTTARKIGTPIRETPLDAQLRIDIPKMVAAVKGAGLVFFCNPNNPTATVHGATAVADFIKEVRQQSPDTVILLDEAYHDYVTDTSYKTAIDLALATPNVFVTRTFSKAYGMAGLRVGYAIGSAPVIKQLARFKMPYNVSVPGIAAGITSLGNQAHIDRESARNTEVRAFTARAFDRMGFKATDSHANFLFIDLRRPTKPFRDACAQEGVLVGRDFPPYEKTHCRISIGTMEEMQRAVEVFRKVLGAAPSTTTQRSQ